MINILKTVFGSINKAEDNLKKFVALNQGTERITEFLLEWQSVCNLSGYNDHAAINTLTTTLHPTLSLKLMENIITLYKIKSRKGEEKAE